MKIVFEFKRMLNVYWMLIYNVNFVFFLFLFFFVFLFDFSSYICFCHNFLNLGVWDRPQLWHVLPPCTSYYPKLWNFGFVGSILLLCWPKEDHNNYRGIILSNCLGKLFNTILYIQKATKQKGYFSGVSYIL